MRRRHPWLSRGAVAALALVVAVGAWAAFDLVRASRDLRAARTALDGAGRVDALLTPQGRARILRNLDQGARLATRARGRIEGSVALRAAAVLPGAAHQRRGAILLAGDAATAARAGSSAVRTIDALATTNRIEGGRLPLEALAELERQAAVSAHALRPTVRRSASLWGPLAGARDAYDREAADAATRLADAADALHAARSFAGEAGVRRYLVAGQNNAELRDQGMVLSYAVLRFEGGRFTVERSGSVDDLRLGRAAPTPLPEGTSALFGSLEPTRIWQSVNATADVELSSRTMLDMFEAATGERLDGVVMIDVPALVELLRVVGPVQAPGVPEAVTADNAVRLLLNDLYRRLPPGADQGPRRDAVAGVARATADRIASSPQDAVRLAQRLSVAARGGHLRLYSSDDEEQATFERVGLGGGPGAMPATAARTFHYSVQNASGTKLDYFARHRVRFDVTTTNAGSAVVRTTVTVVNGAPAGAAPSYVLGPTANQQRAGQYAGRVYLWGPAGSEQFESVEDAGLRASMRVVVAEPQDQGSVTFETQLKGAVTDGVLDLRLVPQPLLVPAHVEVVVDGRPAVDRRWDRTLDLSLRVGSAR